MLVFSKLPVFAVNNTKSASSRLPKILEAVYANYAFETQCDLVPLTMFELFMTLFPLLARHNFCRLPHEILSRLSLTFLLHQTLVRTQWWIQLLHHEMVQPPSHNKHKESLIWILHSAHEEHCWVLFIVKFFQTYGVFRSNLCKLGLNFQKSSSWNTSISYSAFDPFKKGSFVLTFLIFSE